MVKKLLLLSAILGATVVARLGVGVTAASAGEVTGSCNNAKPGPRLPKTARRIRTQTPTRSARSQDRTTIQAAPIRRILAVRRSRTGRTSSQAPPIQARGTRPRWDISLLVLTISHILASPATATTGSSPSPRSESPRLAPATSVGANLPIEGSNSGATACSRVAPGADSRLRCCFPVARAVPHGGLQRLAEAQAIWRSGRSSGPFGSSTAPRGH